MLVSPSKCILAVFLGLLVRKGRADHPAVVAASFLDWKQPLLLALK